MRNMFADTFYELAQNDDRLCMVVADISPAGSMEKFRREMPARFVNTGVAEQIMIGMVAGMAMRGLRPFAYTIATFALYRPFEFIRDDLCYQNLPVTVVGVGGGVAYSTLGGTHHAMEDIAIARAVPNLRVIAPSDAEETRAATIWCAQQQEGPVYLRLGKAGEPIITKEALTPFEFGKVRYLRKGADVCILGYGPILGLAIQAADALALRGISASVVAVHTLKPMDKEGIAQALAKHSRVVVLEEMVPQGGLTDQVKAIAWESGVHCALRAITLKDEFLHVYGTHGDVLKAHGVTLERLMNALIQD